MYVYIYIYIYIYVYIHIIHSALSKKALGLYADGNVKSMNAPGFVQHESVGRPRLYNHTIV